MVALSRQEQADSSRARLVESARACFVERGYEDTTVAEVLGRAGMARGALYHYFPGGKHDLFRAVFASVNDAFHQQRDALLALESPRARIRAGIRLFLDLCTDEAFARVALMDAPGLIPGQAGRGSSYELLLSQLEAAKEAGGLPELQVEATAMALYGAVRSAGEFVAGSADPRAAVTQTLASLDPMVDALGL